MAAPRTRHPRPQGSPITNHGTIGQYTPLAHLPMHLICPPNFCIISISLGTAVTDSGEMKSKDYTKFWGANKVHYGRCASGVFILYS